MKRLWLILFITTFISLAWGQSHCHVFGKIKFVEYGEDYKVKFVEYGEDLNIKYVSYGESQVGNWKTVEYGEKYKIKVVDYGEDFSVKLVDYGEGCNTSGSSSSSSSSSNNANQVQAWADIFSGQRTEKNNTVDSATRLRLELAKMTPKQRAAYFELQRQEEQRKLNKIAKTEREREREKKLQAERSRKLRQENPLFYWAREALAVAII